MFMRLDTPRSNESVKQIRREFIEYLGERGIFFRHKKLELYERGFNAINIKVDRKKNERGEYWFNVATNYMDEFHDDYVDYFVWVCGEYNNYYVIPCQDMKLLAEKAPIDESSVYENKHFRILQKNGGHYFKGKFVEIPIDRFYQNYKVL